jgi:hypothetical protein
LASSPTAIEPSRARPGALTVSKATRIENLMTGKGDLPFDLCLRAFGADWYLNPANDEDTVTVFDKKVHGYPGDKAKRHYPVPIPRLFGTPYEFDAYFTCHATWQAYRLNNAYFELADRAPVRMKLLALDIDAHTLDGEIKAGWKRETLEKLARVQRERGGFIYETNGGFRMVWRVSREIVHPDEWEHFYSAWVCHVSASYEIPIMVSGARGSPGIDASCSNWNRLFRLPLVVREIGGTAVPQRFPTYGTLDDLAFEPRAGFVPPKGQRKRTAGRAYSYGGGTCADPDIARALAHGLAGHLGGDKYAVHCPNRLHNNGRLTSQTVVFAGGKFDCKGGACGEVTRAQWVATLPPAEAPITLDEIETRAVAFMRAGGKGGALCVLDVPPGTGKSHWARSLIARDVAVPGFVGALLAPTTTLATEHRERCGALQLGGIDADVPGRPPCQYPQTVKMLQSAGLPGGLACAQCAAKQGCRTRQGVGNARFGIVGTHEMLPRVLREHDRLILFIDELPKNLLESFEITRADISLLLSPATERFAFARPVKVDWISQIETWARYLETGEGDESAARASAQSADDLPPLGFTPHGQPSPGNAERIRLAAVALQIRRAADDEAKIERTADGVRVMLPSPVLSHLVTHGGFLLTAGAPDALLRNLREDVQILRFEVTDGCEGIERVLVEMSEANTRALKADKPRVSRIVADILKRAARRKTVIFCAKAIEPWVREAAGKNAEVAHYGAVRGLDGWKDADVFATIGDHFQNEEANEREAAFFRLDAQVEWVRKVSFELEQAHGRARDPRRDKPALHLHYGNVIPNRWTDFHVEQWQGASAAQRQKADREKIGRLKAQGKSSGEIAKRLRVSKRTAEGVRNPSRAALGKKAFLRKEGAAIRDLVGRGVPLAKVIEIGRELGLSKRVIYKYAKSLRKGA